jgi:hypothetical protein
MLRLEISNTPSTIVSWSSITANPNDLLVMGTRRLTLADAKVSAVLRCANAAARCLMICDVGDASE